MMERRALQDELVLPSLFWRIDELERRGGSRGVSIPVYRNEVMRNLRWLLNATALPSDHVAWELEETSRSVINFGLPPYIGKIGDNLDGESFSRMIRSTILAFEPRIIPNTLRVVTKGSEDASDLSDIDFTIEGSIWCEPVPERFLMSAHIDGASGEWSFES